MPDKTSIANLALSHLGARQASDITTDTTQQAISANLWFDSARKEALRSHPWNFATARQMLTTTYVALSGSAITSSSGLIKVTKTGHGLTTGTRIYLKDVQGVTSANGRWYITKVDDDSFTLDSSVFGGTYTSGTGSYVVVPNDGWQFRFLISSLTLTNLRILKINGNDGHDSTDGAEHQLEGGYIFADCETIHVHYIFDQSDYTAWAPDFITAFSYLLASYIAQNITGPAGKAAELRQMYETTFLPLARSRDAREAKSRRTLPFDSSQAITARFGGMDPLSSNTYDR